MSCKYFLRIPTKTAFISAESWKSYQLTRGHVIFLFTYDTCDIVTSWSIFLLPSIVLDNLFGYSQPCIGISQDVALLFQGLPHTIALLLWVIIALVPELNLTHVVGQGLQLGLLYLATFLFLDVTTLHVFSLTLLLIFSSTLFTIVGGTLLSVSSLALLLWNI